MSEKLKELLEKINKEGVIQAEEAARAIESKARREAEKIIRDASAQAQKIVEDAESSAKKTGEAAEMTLKQAARDLTLSLKDEIRKILNKIIAAETEKAMSSENLKDILLDLIETYVEKDGKSSDIKVLLNKEDLEKLKKVFVAKLQEKLKDGIEFKASPNVNAGFSISFDKGRSYFDFTDEGLIEALCAYLNPELAKLLK